MAAQIRGFQTVKQKLPNFCHETFQLIWKYLLDINNCIQQRISKFKSSENYLSYFDDFDIYK